MLRRDWALKTLAYLAFAEVLSLAPVSDLSLCLIQPEHGEQATDHDDKKYCPHLPRALFIGAVLRTRLPLRSRVLKIKARFIRLTRLTRSKFFC
jgi:hypothetical protein